MEKHIVFNNIAVVGAGAMGTGIAQVVSQSGAKVYLYDISYENALSAKRKLGQTFEKLVSKKKFNTNEAKSILKTHLNSYTVHSRFSDTFGLSENCH